MHHFQPPFPSRRKEIITPVKTRMALKSLCIDATQVTYSPSERIRGNSDSPSKRRQLTCGRLMRFQVPKDDAILITRHG